MLARLLKVTTLIVLGVFLIKAVEYGALSALLTDRGCGFSCFLTALFREPPFLLAFLFLGGMPFVLWGRFRERSATIGLHAFAFGVLLLELLLTLYYTETLLPLDQTILYLSPQQLGRVVRNFGRVDLFAIACFLSLPVLYYLLWRIVRPLRLSLFFLLALPVGLALLYPTRPQLGHYPTRMVYYHQYDKLLFFLKSLAKTFEDSRNGREFPNLGWSVATFQEFKKNKRFLEREGEFHSYPFLHHRRSRNTLGPFFRKTSRPPDLVFLLVEGLSAEFSGGEPGEVSFTPFLDSLARHSLYFPNTLSASDRTFRLLPALFGSLPHGGKGFLNTGRNMPLHHSLLKTLHGKGYETAFYLSHEASYDNMEGFMRRQGVNAIIDRDDLPRYIDRPEHPRQGQTDSTIWGYLTDGDLLEGVLAHSRQHLASPFCQVILTLSLHYPFRFPDEARYRSVYRRIRDQSKGTRYEAEVKHYDEVFSCLLYVDDQLREFFERYQQRPEYENTLFIITGDHMVAGLPRKAVIDDYRVPLLIWSPLLKRGKTIRAVNSHLDLAPSLLALYEAQYGWTRPEQVHWLGSVLDTSAAFGSDRRMTFMRQNREVALLRNRYFLSDGRLYELQENLQTRAIGNDSLRPRLQKELKAVQQVHRYGVAKDKILPPGMLSE